MSDAGGDPDASSPSDTSSTADQVDPCAASYDDSQFGLRIGSIFVILVSHSSLSLSHDLFRCPGTKLPLHRAYLDLYTTTLLTPYHPLRH